NPAINNLVQSSLGSKHKLEWISYEKITNIEPTQVNYVYYARTGYDSRVILVFLGNSAKCTPTFVSEFSRKYSLPTDKYSSDVSQFRRYKKWLYYRNKLILGFTKTNDKTNDKYRSNKLIKIFTKLDNSYYMVADSKFYHCYTQYGFCTACGILRCSPVWCICGRKQLSNGWTSKNKQLDEFIKKTQLQTNSPNYAYLEWIPFDCIRDRGEYIG